jgi:hypothetical protein
MGRSEALQVARSASGSIPPIFDILLNCYIELLHFTFIFILPHSTFPSLYIKANLFAFWVIPLIFRLTSIISVYSPNESLYGMKRLSHPQRLVKLKLETLEAHRIKTDLPTMCKILLNIIAVEFTDFFHNIELVKPLSRNNARLFSFSCRCTAMLDRNLL